jgi:hypothetical protein
VKHISLLRTIPLLQKIRKTNTKETNSSYQGSIKYTSRDMETEIYNQEVTDLSKPIFP